MRIVKDLLETRVGCGTLGNIHSIYFKTW